MLSISADAVVSTLEGGEYTIIPGGHVFAGGYGMVYRAAEIGGGRRTYAVKFLIERDRSDLPPDEAAEVLEKGRARFENEIRQLKAMNAAASKEQMANDGFVFPFPRYCGRGVKAKTPFYVMEWLEPINYREIDTDAERVEFVCALCDAVRLLHDNGLVHYDIKPSNIMRRLKNGTSDKWEYVLSDFGSVHEIDKRGDNMETNISPDSVSCLPDGRRFVVPNTPGYADPLEDLHTVNGDIYAIGQVIRDLFATDVSPHWAPFIFKCISRNRDYRYERLEQLKDDVLKMVHGAAVYLTNAFAELTGPDGIAWTAEKRRLYVKHGAKDGVGTAKQPFGTISEALSAAEDDDIIEVAPGRYKENLDIINKRVSILGTAGARKTYLIGDHRKSVIRLQEGSGASLIKGFTISGGLGTAIPSVNGADYYGGGVYSVVSCLFEDCIITSNGKGVPKVSACTYGGGVFVSGATMTIRNCLVKDNCAWGCGGGLMAAHAGGTLVVDNCTIEGNDSTDYIGGRKGGIALSDNAILLLAESVVQKNGGDQIGGFGVHAKGTRADIEDSLVAGGAVAKDIDKFICGKGNKDRPSKATAKWGAHF